MAGNNLPEIHEFLEESTSNRRIYEIICVVRYSPEKLCNFGFPERPLHHHEKAKSSPCFRCFSRGPSPRQVRNFSKRIPINFLLFRLDYVMMVFLLVYPLVFDFILYFMSGSLECFLGMSWTNFLHFIIRFFEGFNGVFIAIFVARRKEFPGKCLACHRGRYSVKNS